MTVAIGVYNVTKTYKLYANPIDRVKEALHPLRKKCHQTFTALNDISFEVNRGETVGIIGKNGAGKSTLLKIISGVLTPSSGSCFVNGRISSLLELGTGFNPELNGIENAYFNAMLLDIPAEEIRKKIDSIIAFADIGEFINRPVKIYSSGMFSRLAFAVAFHVEPDILIVDEALSVGDMSFQKKCFDKFHEIRSKGSTILFVSHDPYQVKGYCQKALYLKNGNCVSFGKSRDVVDDYVYDQEKETLEKSKQQEQIVVSEKLDPSETNGESPPIPQNSSNHLIQITSVALVNDKDREIKEVVAHETIKLKFTYRILGDFTGQLSFVFNIYKHDNFYVCGATSVMDKLPSFPSKKEGTVTVVFEDFPLLAGRYKCRVAINDGEGLGIYTEAVPVCDFQVLDNFESVGLVHLKRTWLVE